MMNKKETLIGIIIIITLSLILGLLWFLIINNTNSNNIQSINTSSNTVYSAVKKITKDENIKNKSYKSIKANQNVVLVKNKINSLLSNLKINKSGDSNGGDNTSFYGTNSGILAKDGANLTIKNSTIKTNATGANGVFSYGGSATTQNSSGDGTTVNISDSKITTTKDDSGGIMTTGGGVMNANNLIINTAGTSSAAIRSDRGGGVVKVNKGTYTTTGKGSPAVYSTADITVKNATLISKASEGLVIEGKNKIKLEKVKLIDTNNTLNGQSTTYKNIFIYQSMSGDADNGTAEFSSTNSNIVTNKGDTIYVTNTKANIILENNKITNNDKKGNFIRIQKDSWGNNGSNGGEVNLKLINQKVKGNIVVDSISKLTMKLTKKSSYKGTINSNNKAKNIKLVLSKNSKIKLTGNSYISELDDEDSIYSNIDLNGYKLYIGNKELKK